LALDRKTFLDLLAKANSGALNSATINNSGASTTEKAQLNKALSNYKLTQRTAASTTGALKGTVGALSELGGTLNDITGGTTLFEQGLKGIGSAGIEMANNMLNAKSATELLNGGLEGTLKSVNAVLKPFSKVIDSVEDYRIGLNRSGVDGGKFIESLRRQQDALDSYNITFESINRAFVNFQSNLAGVVSTGFPTQRAELLKVAAINEKFGVGIGVSTRFLNQLDTGLQLTARQTDVFSRRLQKFAFDTGQPVTKVFDDFTSSASKFFVELDPDKALRKFTVFQQIARRLGSDVTSLTQLTDQFETIEGGMAFGGKLNMLLSNLGGSFDAVQATMMSQPERMEYIAGQVAQVGDRIRGMSDLGQRAILRELAGTLNVDVGMIRSLINRDKTAEINRFVAGTSGLGAMGAEEQAKRAREMTTRQEKVQITNEKLMGKFTISSERLAQAATDMRQAVNRLGQRAMLNQADKLVPKMSATATTMEQAAQSLNTGTADFTTKLAEVTSKFVTSTTNMTQALDRNTSAQRMPASPNMTRTPATQTPVPGSQPLSDANR
tara:strand:+ start:1359 stop:3020 length:1662 start_codon:yes stop_codon:yes gene_type:complete